MSHKKSVKDLTKTPNRESKTFEKYQLICEYWKNNKHNTTKDEMQEGLG